MPPIAPVIASILPEVAAGTAAPAMASAITPAFASLAAPAAAPAMASAITPTFASLGAASAPGGAELLGALPAATGFLSGTAPMLSEAVPFLSQTTTPSMAASMLGESSPGVMDALKGLVGDNPLETMIQLGQLYNAFSPNEQRPPTPPRPGTNMTPYNFQPMGIPQDKNWYLQALYGGR